MAFLTLGGTTVAVAASSASQDTSEAVGSESRAYAGNLRVTTRAKKRVWKISTRQLTLANATTIRALDRTITTLNGDIVGGVSVSVYVIIGQSPYMARGPRQQLQITLKEV